MFTIWHLVARLDRFINRVRWAARVCYLSPAAAPMWLMPRNYFADCAQRPAQSRRTALNWIDADRGAPPRRPGGKPSFLWYFRSRNWECLASSCS